MAYINIFFPFFYLPQAQQTPFRSYLQDMLALVSMSFIVSSFCMHKPLCSNMFLSWFSVYHSLNQFVLSMKHGYCITDVLKCLSSMFHD